MKPHETLEKIGILRSLDAKEIAALDRRCLWRHAQAKAWLLEQDDMGTDIYFLTSGAVRVPEITSYALSEAATAHAVSEGRHLRGKLVFKVR